MVDAGRIFTVFLPWQNGNLARARLLRKRASHPQVGFFTQTGAEWRDLFRVRCN